MGRWRLSDSTICWGWNFSLEQPHCGARVPRAELELGRADQGPGVWRSWAACHQQVWSLTQFYPRWAFSQSRGHWRKSTLTVVLKSTILGLPYQPSAYGSSTLENHFHFKELKGIILRVAFDLLCITVAWDLSLGLVTPLTVSLFLLNYRSDMRGRRRWRAPSHEQILLQK